MKTRLTCLFVLVFIFSISYSQVPRGFNYQAIARDESKNPITVPIGVRFTIRADSISGTIFWIEEHTSVTPNEDGVFNVVIGKGTRKSGLAKFSDIDWTVTPKYVMTEINYGGWQLLGSSRLWTVPYAMVADSIGAPFKKLVVSGVTTNMEEPLFEVKNTAGKTVFAVYNEGVRIYVGDGNTNAKGAKGGFAVSSMANSKAEAPNFLYVSKDSIRAYVYDDPTGKAVKGGFAVSGFNNSKKQTNDYLLVSPDSVRIFIDKAPDSKAPKGGFAVTGYGNAKAYDEEYFRVTRDSTRVYVNKDLSKGAKGGFAVGSFADSKTLKPKYLSVLPTRTNIQVTDTLNGFSVSNYALTGSSGFVKIDKLNSFIGHETGPVNAPSLTGEGGKYNVFIGYQSGNKNTTGYKNVFLGYRAGQKNLTAEHNIFIGTESGVSNVAGRYNTFIGSETGVLTTSSENTFVGYSAGVLNETGAYNTFLGTNSGAFHSSGNYNTYLGWGSGNNNSGSNNVFIGASSGSSNTGSGNIYIGYNTNKQSAVSSSNRLIINNYYNSISTPLIYGEFDNKRVVINGIHTDNPSNYTFFVNGTAGGTAAWNSLSDARFKTDITTIENALEKVLKLRGVNYNWKNPEPTEEGRRIGFIAQEVETVVPEVITKSEDIYMMQYAPVTALLVEAIKEQQKIILDQKEIINELVRKNELMENKLDKIDTMLNDLNLNKY